MTAGLAERALRTTSGDEAAFLMMGLSPPVKGEFGVRPAEGGGMRPKEVRSYLIFRSKHLVLYRGLNVWQDETGERGAEAPPVVLYYEDDAHYVDLNGDGIKE